MSLSGRNGVDGGGVKPITENNDHFREGNWLVLDSELADKRTGALPFGSAPHAIYKPMVQYVAYQSGLHLISIRRFPSVRVVTETPAFGFPAAARRFATSCSSS